MSHRVGPQSPHSMAPSGARGSCEPPGNGRESTPGGVPGTHCADSCPYPPHSACNEEGRGAASAQHPPATPTCVSQSAYGRRPAPGLVASAAATLSLLPGLQPAGVLLPASLPFPGPGVLFPEPLVHSPLPSGPTYPQVTFSRTPWT